MEQQAGGEVVTERPQRSIVLADGNLARRNDDVEIIVPPGYAPVMGAEPEGGGT
jgi:hypothetical protein